MFRNIFICVFILFVLIGAGIFLSKEKVVKESFYIKKMNSDGREVTIMLNKNLNHSIVTINGAEFSSSIIKKIDEGKFQINFNSLNESFFIDITKEKLIEPTKSKKLIKDI